MPAGLDPGAIALALLNYLGGAGGAAIAGASILATYLLCGLHVMHPKAGYITTILIILAWGTAWTMRLLGWTVA